MLAIAAAHVLPVAQDWHLNPRFSLLFGESLLDHVIAILAVGCFDEDLLQELGLLAILARDFFEPRLVDLGYVNA